MKIKSYEAHTIEEVDDLVNKFEEEESVKATHTAHVWNPNLNRMIHYYTVFYIPKAVDKTGKSKEPVIKHKIVKG